MRKNAFNYNLRSQVSQRDSADEGVDRSELQVHHCITPEQRSWLMYSGSAIPVKCYCKNKINWIGIKILASDFLKFLVLSRFFQEANTRFAPYVKTVASPLDWGARFFIIIFVFACFNEILKDTTKYEGHKIWGGKTPNAVLKN